MNALAPGQVFGVSDRVLRGVAGSDEHHVHPVGPERVGRDRRDQRRVDAAGQGLDHRAEAVLAHVVPGAQYQRAVDLGQVGQPRPDHRGRRAARPAPAAASGASSIRSMVIVVPSPGFARCLPAGTGAEPRRAASRSARTSASSNCGPAGQQVAIRRHDDRVAVEDQLVLAADHVDVGQHGACLARPALAQLQPDVVLVALVRRGVGHDQQSGARCPGAPLPGRRPATGPRRSRPRHRPDSPPSGRSRTTGSVSPGTK